MEEFRWLVAGVLRFGQNLTQRHRGIFRQAVTEVGKLSADPDGQRKEGQEEIEGRLEPSSIYKHTGHIEVYGHQCRWQKEHGGDEEHHVRHLIQPLSIRPALASLAKGWFERVSKVSSLGLGVNANLHEATRARLTYRAACLLRRGKAERPGLKCSHHATTMRSLSESLPT